ncbi:hypothetical protein [Sphingomonas sp. CROZ-RG-20F-R02-07]|uniref:hypothetical protein n=1 Tax=Sphingomonas sp. CROZ-RG-20F-R02-07 TaxID=2914832 RepID=UPI001F56FF6C|nr:hypothetical protein [Sphingomonas sp. CROZ-RG-20F-R02-07]
MTVGDYFISFVVVVLVLIAAWRGGQVNPTGTGRLGTRIGELELKVGEHGVKMAAIERSVLELADTARHTNDGIQALRIELAADRGVTERTWEATDRLQKFFMEEGFRRITDR